MTAGPPTLLALETATATCSAAVLMGSRTVQRIAVVDRRHAETLLPMIIGALAESGCRFADLDAVAVGIGPGAFTSLRAGLAAAHGIALASGRPCFGISSLEAVAWRLRVPGRARLAVLDSRREELLVQAFDDAGLEPLTPPLSLPVDALVQRLPPRRWVVGGDSAARVLSSLRAAGLDAIDGAVASPDAEAVGQRARCRWQADERPTASPQPLYLRPPDIGPAR